MPRSGVGLGGSLARWAGLVSGKHASLAGVPELRTAAEITGKRLIDVRNPPSSLPIATGRKRPGCGIPMDAVVSDFVAGAAESLSPNAAVNHWDVIEGQGSLFHPSYAGVTLGILHGSQPDVIVVCHDPGREEILDHPGYLIPSIPQTIDLASRLGRRVNDKIRCGGSALNTSQMSAVEADEVIASTGKKTGLPVADPIRGRDTFDFLVESCLGH